MTLPVPKARVGDHCQDVQRLEVLTPWKNMSTKALISWDFMSIWRFDKSFLWRAPFWVELERVGWGTFKEAKDNWIFSWFNCNPMYTLNLGFVRVQRSSHGNWSRDYWIDCTAVMIHGIDLWVQLLKCLDSFFELLRKFFNSMKNLGVEAIAHEQAKHEWVWTSWFSDWGSVCTCSSCLICLGTILWRVGLTLQRWDSTGKAPVRVGNGSNFHMRK